MKKTLLATLSAVVLAVGAGVAHGAVTLNLGHTLAPDSAYNAVGVRLAEVLEKKSNGDMKVNVFPQSQLGGEVKMIQAARAGALDMFITAQAPLTNTIKEYSIFDLPYLFDSVEQANAVLAGPVGQKFLDMLPKYNLIGLGFPSALERNVFSAKPIQTGEEMSGMKLRVMQAPGYVKTYEAFGAQPTPMAYGDVYLALQQGVIDGADVSPDQFVLDKLMEVSKNYNLTRVHNMPVLLIISKARWDRLSEEQQKLLREATEEALEYGREYYLKSYKDSIEAMKANNVNVVETDLTILRKLSEKTTADLLKEIPNGQALFDEIQQAKQALGGK